MNNGMGEGPKKPRDVGESAGFKRKGKPNVEMERELTPPDVFAGIARDIKQSLEGAALDPEEVQDERDSLAGLSTAEIEQELEKFAASGWDDKEELAFALAEEYEERQKQPERSDIEAEL